MMMALMMVTTVITILTVINVIVMRMIRRGWHLFVEPSSMVKKQTDYNEVVVKHGLQEKR